MEECDELEDYSPPSYAFLSEETMTYRTDTTAVNEDDEELLEPYLIHCLREGEWSDALERIQTHSYETKWRGYNNETVFMAAIANTMNLPVPLGLLRRLKDNCGTQVLGERTGTKRVRSGSDPSHNNSNRVTRWGNESKLVNPVTLAIMGLAEELLTQRVGPHRPPSDFEQRLGVIQQLLRWEVNLVDEAVPYLTVVWNRLHRSEPIPSSCSTMVSLPPVWKNLFQLLDEMFYAVIHRTPYSANHRTRIHPGVDDAQRKRERRDDDLVVTPHFLHRLILVHSRLVPLSSSLIQTAIRLSPPRACIEFDYCNQTPLIVAISQLEPSKNTKHECTCCRNCGTPMCNESFPSLLQDKRIKALPTLPLLSKKPESARITDKNGRLPLHLAIEYGQIWSDQTLQALISSEPRAIHARDIQTKLYPFMLAAIGKDSDMDTVLELLRMNPLLAKGLAYGNRKGEDDTVNLKILNNENKKLKDTVLKQETEIGRLKEKIRLLESKSNEKNESKRARY